MLRGRFVASGTGGIQCIKGMMKSEDYQGISARNVLPSVRKLGRRQKVLGLSAGQRPPSSHPAAQKTG